MKPHNVKLYIDSIRSESGTGVTIKDITEDKDGTIWLGHTDVTLELPEGIRDTTMGVSSARMIHSILEDNKGNIWITSNAGLFSYEY